MKVIGLTNTPLIVDLLSFDTIRTLHRVIQARLPAARYGRGYAQLTATPSIINRFRLYTGLPRIMVADKSDTLQDLGMVPRGVLYARGVQ